MAVATPGDTLTALPIHHFAGRHSDMSEVALLAVLIFAAAILYSSVGYAGASGYLAAMALVGVAPDVMKPTALALNILVASIAMVRYIMGLMRKAEVRSRETLLEAMDWAISALSAQDASSFFRHCGYRVAVHPF